MGRPKMIENQRKQRINATVSPEAKAAADWLKSRGINVSQVIEQAIIAEVKKTEKRTRAMHDPNQQSFL